jgi:hypothetical protein
MSDGLGFGRKKLVTKIIEENYKVRPEEKNYSYNDILYILQELLTLEGKPYHTGEAVANRGHTIFRGFVEMLVYRNIANYDSMVLLTAQKGCITGDALLEMPRDLKKYPKGIPLKELDGKGPQWVYSFNIKSQKIELKKCDGVEFVKNDDVWEIELVNGQKIQATKDHPFLLTNGTYRQLKDIIYKNQKGNDKLNISINKKLFSQEVKSITYKGKKDVYDVVNVQDNKNFIVNGFMVSNTGKSSAAIMLAREWCRIIGIKFDPKRHIAYSNEDVSRKIDMLNKFEPLIADEAVRFACLEGDVIIDTKEGKIKIKDLVNKQNFEVKSFNNNTKKFEYKNAKKCIKTKIDTVYEIELENGKKIKATKEHKFLTSNGWKTLEELSEGDLIGTTD